MIILKRLMQDRGAVIAMSIILLYVVLGLFAPIVTYYEPNHINTSDKFAGISWSHWLGTDHLGRYVNANDLRHQTEFIICVYRVICVRSDWRNSRIDSWIFPGLC